MVLDGAARPATQSCSINSKARARTLSSESLRASISGSTDPVRPCLTQVSRAWSRTWTSGFASALNIHVGTMSGFSGGVDAADVAGGGVVPARPVVVALLVAGVTCDSGPPLAPTDNSWLDGSLEETGPQPDKPVSRPRMRSRITIRERCSDAPCVMSVGTQALPYLEDDDRSDRLEVCMDVRSVSTGLSPE